MIHTLQLGIGFKAKLVIGIIWAPFFLAQLLEHHVGIVRTHVGNIGVTEGQLAQSAVMLACTILGSDIYNTPINEVLGVIGYGDLLSPDYQLRDIVVVILTLNGAMYSLFLIAEMILSIETVMGKLECLFRMIPLVMLAMFLYLTDPNDQFSAKHGALLLIAGGLTFTICTTKLIISTMALMPYSGIQLESFIFGAYFYAQYNLTGKDHDKNQKYAFIF